MKNKTKKLLALLMTLIMILGALTGCGNGGNTRGDVTVRIGSMSGPTSFGLVKLMDDAENGNTKNKYEFAELATDATAFVTPIVNNELDIAAVPSNLASVLYNKTEGNVQVIAVNNLCVLNIVERGESVNSVSDLAGKKIYATGEGAVPECVLRYILSANGINPDSDLEIQWCADTTEALSFVTNDENAIAMLPQPFVLAAMAQVEGLRIALDLNNEWNALGTGCEQVTGVIVVRKDFAEANPEVVETFLEEYKASMDYTLNSSADASLLIEKYGIVGKAALAEKAIPKVNLKYEVGDEMKATVSGFLNIMNEFNARTVGGAVPGDDFYYGAN